MATLFGDPRNGENLHFVLGYAIGGLPDQAGSYPHTKPTHVQASTTYL